LKLLFDANLSPKLVARLAELFPDSMHVFSTGMERFTPDENIWSYATVNGFVIVTADADFVHLSKKRGAPPKVVRLENCNYKPPSSRSFCDRTPFELRNWSSPAENS
jgi:predicted nuclease of predicted toxin-antitoxin system